MNENMIGTGRRIGRSVHFKVTLMGVAFALIMAPAFAHAASVGLGATVMCAWWDSAGKAYLMGGSKVDPEPAAAGGPFLTAQINDTWGLNIGYTYGKFTWNVATPLIGYKSEDERHDLDFIVSAAVHRYVKLFFGAKYWGTKSDMTTRLVLIPMGSSFMYHRGGPGAGIGLSLPLGAGFYLMPNISSVFMFGRITEAMGGPLGSLVGKFMERTGSNGVTMYFGLNSTLSLAYNIEKANLTLALGGRFQYLWIYFIEAERLGNGNDMYAGITFSAMYTFNIPGNGAGKK
jgi:hypothetical protein